MAGGPHFVASCLRVSQSVRPCSPFLRRECRDPGKNLRRSPASSWFIRMSCEKGCSLFACRCRSEKIGNILDLCETNRCPEASSYGTRDHRRRSLSSLTRLRNEANSEGVSSVKRQVSSRRRQENGPHPRSRTVRAKRSQFADRGTGLPAPRAELGSFVRLAAVVYSECIQGLSLLRKRKDR